MTVIGVTGGSGCGKSTFGLCLQERYGALFIDADAVYHRLLDEDGDLRGQLIAAFGEDIAPEGSISRPALAKVVFSDENALQKLNAITHPAVCRAIREELAAADAPVAVVDAFGLIQGGLDALCQVTVAVLADREERIARICQRDGISPEAAAARIDAQPGADFYISRCDHVLFNNGTPEEFFSRCDALAKQILAQ